jgi:hypothetical protein
VWEWEQPEQTLARQREETAQRELTHELIIDFDLAVAGYVILINDRGSCNDVPNQTKPNQTTETLLLLLLLGIRYRY